MSETSPFSSNGKVHTPTAEKKPVPALVMMLIAFPLFLLVIIPTVITIMRMTGKPAFESLAELKNDDIARLEVRMFNLREVIQREQDELGPYVAKPEHYERLLAPLRAAHVTDEQPPKMFLGEIRIQLKDGQQQAVRLSFVDLGSGVPRELMFKIGGQMYRGGPVGDWVKTADICDPRPK